MRMQLNASEIHHPRGPRGTVDDDLLGGAAGGERQRDGLEPLRSVLGCSLLVKRLALRAIHVALEDQRSIADACERSRCNRQVVVNQLELRELHLSRKVRLLRIGYPDVVTLDRQYLGSFFLCHPGTA